ncbi:hypothetical protein U1Q18_008182 [Sarracenia purpurea var. burkii]
MLSLSTYTSHPSLSFSSPPQFTSPSVNYFSKNKNPKPHFLSQNHTYKTPIPPFFFQYHSLFSYPNLQISPIRPFFLTSISQDISSVPGYFHCNQTGFFLTSFV